ncbi:MAG: TniB family NTP-binding protein [Candidatus Methylacidiphilales bacterium]|nr:TniB family NTP-binding protein [Candidatus Methylacidiphilales bacterium]
MSSHLHRHVIPHLSLPMEARVLQLTEEVWIPYRRGEEILDYLQELLMMNRRARPHSALLVGPTNNGKSFILKEFLLRNPSPRCLPSEADVAPIVYIQAPEEPKESTFFDAILGQFSTPCRPGDPVNQKRYHALQILKGVGTKILIIDEIQHILAGDNKRQRVMLNLIKYLSNELGISIVAAGVETALNAIQIDNQVANRFLPIPLPRWKYDEEYRKLLATFEAVIPLALPSAFASREMSYVLWEQSGGLIGELSTLLATAARFAIKNGEERITIEILNAIDWTAPGDRRRKTELTFEPY